MANNRNHGGRRVAGPGKKLGAPVLGRSPQKIVQITIDADALEGLKNSPGYKENPNVKFKIKK